jgi:hypothetical protein
LPASFSAAVPFFSQVPFAFCCEGAGSFFCSVCTQVFIFAAQCFGSYFLLPCGNLSCLCFRLCHFPKSRASLSFVLAALSQIYFGRLSFSQSVQLSVCRIRVQSRFPAPGSISCSLTANLCRKARSCALDLSIGVVFSVQVCLFRAGVILVLAGRSLMLPPCFSDYCSEKSQFLFLLLGERAGCLLGFCHH